MAPAKPKAISQSITDQTHAGARLIATTRP
jgi:hypothetical protein